MSDRLAVIYWDSTALFSYLFKDEYSDIAQEKARQSGVHLVTTLAIAEVCTVISRVQREQMVSDLLAHSLFDILEYGPWSKLNIVPDTMSLRELAGKWALRGTELWHLATAKTLQKEFPELMILTFDRELARASKGEELKLCVTVQ